MQKTTDGQSSKGETFSLQKDTFPPDFFSANTTEIYLVCNVACNHISKLAKEKKRGYFKEYSVQHVC